jgi:hypothetical protein
VDGYLFEDAALTSKLDANQFGSPAILDASQFESSLDFADRQNRNNRLGLHGRKYGLEPEPSVQMKFGAATLTTLILLAASMPALAKKNPPRPFQLRQEVVLNGAQVPAGTYELSWETQGSKVQVTLRKEGKFVAIADGALVKSGRKYNEDEALLRVNSDGSKSLIEIRIAGADKAIVLNSAGTIVRYTAMKH